MTFIAMQAHLKHTTNLSGKEILVHVNGLSAARRDFFEAIALVRSIVGLEATTAKNNGRW